MQGVEFQQVVGDASDGEVTANVGGGGGAEARAQARVRGEHRQ